MNFLCLLLVVVRQYTKVVVQSIRDVGSILIAAIDLFNLVYLIINQFLKYSLGVLVWNHFILMIDEAEQSFI